MSKLKFISDEEKQLRSFEAYFLKPLNTRTANKTSEKETKKSFNSENSLGNREEEKSPEINVIATKPKNIKITYEQQEIINLKDLIFSESDYFPHVIGSKYESWEQYQNNMFFLLKELNVKFS